MKYSWSMLRNRGRDAMNLQVKGQTSVPPGFRFHPTEEELLCYYLKKKVAYEKIDLDVIRHVDLNKLEPWDIQEKCRIGSTTQRDWYLFSHKDKKYPTGTRTNRATAAGFWKATGRDKVIYSSSKRIGMRKTLVFYMGRAPHGQKSDWIMHEYRLDDILNSPTQANVGKGTESMQEEGWVVCKVFVKKNHHHKREETSFDAAVAAMKGPGLISGVDGTLDQILQYMSRTWKQESRNKLTQFTQHEALAQLLNDRRQYELRLRHFFDMETTSSTTATTAAAAAAPAPNMAANLPSATINGHDCTDPRDCSGGTEQGVNDWATLDRLVASHLNGQEETSKQLACFNGQPTFLCQTPEADLHFPPLLQQNTKLFSATANNSDNDMDLWTFSRSSTDSGFLSSNIV